MNPTLDPAITPGGKALHTLVRSACDRIPPLWTLRNFVAVNPFVGLAGRPFVAAARLMQQAGHGEMLMPAAFYTGQIDSGRIGEDEFQAALQRAGDGLPAGGLAGIRFATLGTLRRELAKCGDEKAAPFLTYADFLDLKKSSGWAAFVVEEISKWCSVYFDQGQSAWRMPWRQLGLFAAWKEAAQLDANPEMTGLEGFRAFVAALPNDPFAVIGRALDTLAVPEGLRADFLHRELMSIAGWSSYARFVGRERSPSGGGADPLAELLAVRLAYDLALLARFGAEGRPLPGWNDSWSGAARAGETVSAGLLARHVAQLALEQAYQNELVAGLKSNRPPAPASGRKALQAVFCIDVRSEIFRRALESESDAIETIGFAGFFGMTIEYVKFGGQSGGARCPVLLTPGIRVREALRGGGADEEAARLRKMDFRRTVGGAWSAFKTSAISCFSFVETAGLWFGVKLVRDSLALGRPDSAFAAAEGRCCLGPKIDCETGCAPTAGGGLETGIPLADQIAMAGFALKNMGLMSDFARVVLICGHGATTANNPYGSALDCGACGGHAGDANARVAADILNQSAVREGLKARGIHIPAETVFLAGLHNTTTDEVLLYDTESLPPGRAAELEKIKAWLAGASGKSRRARASSLGLGAVPETKLDDAVRALSRDWSEVRPEWGLAGNAAFIAAPRSRTQGLNLGGRAFLHNYDERLDPDHSTLELIMVAPMVVASWINLQYFGSTVDNRLFGSGNKALHNVVGTFGVWQGNGGDLQTGLPLQSLHDGARWRHEPLRLNVFIEAAPAAIGAVLARQPGVRELIENGWVNLFALDAAGPEIRRYTGGRFVEEPPLEPETRQSSARRRVPAVPGLAEVITTTA